MSVSESASPSLEASPAKWPVSVVRVGALAAVLAAVPYAVFDLDRFFVPKELALHLTALLAGLALFRRQSDDTRRDLWLTLFLLLSAISAIFATNHWLALRALAISASAIVLFWSVRGDRRALNAVGIAVIVAALTSLLQAYGVRLDIFALNRSPGGTLGNRNFVAHMCAFGLPVLFAMPKKFALPGVAIVTAALVLTRSRGGWLATAVMIVVYLGSVVFMRQWPLLRRFVVMLAAAAVGVAAALLLPNTLRWNSGNPYMESVQSVANYQEGSGRGRLVQYRRSLLLAVRHPLLGVGPGNWPVKYPERVPGSDPSLDPNRAGMTYNPWPSSDWIAFIAERGLAATILLLLAFLAIARRGDPTTLAILAAVGVAGLFDAVLLLAAPSLLVWAALGANVGTGFSPPHRGLKPAATVALLITLAGCVYSAAQLAALIVYPQSVARASALDPGNYRMHVQLARGRGRCEHAVAAHKLFPASAEAANLARGCR
jgi:O-antigen ligase